MKVRLELVHKKAKVKKVWLKADTIIGRSTECGLRIASSEVSRQHCKLCLSDEGVTVRDLGSSNGTFVNGYQLEPETDYEIAPDSELSLGGIKFFVRFQEPPAPVMPVGDLGSTIDLKPEHATLPEETVALEPSDEVLPYAEADETPEPETREPLPLSQTGTVQMTRPRDSDLVSNDSDLKLSAHGDSAILEREGNNSPEPVLPEVEPDVSEEDVIDLELAEEPETKEVPNDRLIEEIQRASQKARRSDEKTGSARSKAPAAGDEDESLGDFFKQFD